MNHMLLAEIIETRVQAKRETRAEIAKALDISEGYLSVLASGKATPSLDVFRRIAAWCQRRDSRATYEVMAHRPDDLPLAAGE